MLQGALIKFDKTSSYKNLLQKRLDNVCSCTRNASSKNKYGLSINDLLLFTLIIPLVKGMNVFVFRIFFIKN